MQRKKCGILAAVAIGLFSVRAESRNVAVSSSERIGGKVVARDFERKLLSSEPGLPVIPKVSEFTPSGNGFWMPRPSLNAVARGGDAGKVKALLEMDWRKCFADDGGSGTVVELEMLADEALGDEGYRMEIAVNRIRIAAATRTGLYWGTRTLLQLARSGEKIPCGTVTDRPAYPLRGMTLDVGRKFFPMAFLRDLANELAYCKMNTLHVHLNDDSVCGKMRYWAFRLESDIPGLTALDGSYTKDEFRRFVKDCAEIGVNVIPEFDAPGHSLAFCAVRPELKLTNGWNQMEVSNPKTLPFIKRVWNEYLDGDNPVFVGPDVHAGTDEYCRGSIEGYRAFADGLFRHLLAKGKRVHAWGSFSTCTGTTAVVASPDITIDLWSHWKYLPEKAVEDGYSGTSVPGAVLYIVPGAGYYHDYVNVKEIVTGWSPKIGDRDNPIPADAPRLKGGKFAVWNDVIGNGITVDDVFDRVYPALRAVAEKTWSPSATDWSSYVRRSARVGEAPGLDLLDAHNPDTLGWTTGGWEVSFGLRASGMAEALFDDGTSRVRIFPCGRLGFSRDGYDVEFDFAPEVGKWYEIRMSGTNRRTSLYVDGKLVNDFNPEPWSYPGDTRRKYYLWRTLRFPVRPAVGRTSDIRNFKAKCAE